MQISELKAQIKNGTLAGVYIFCGEENFLKRYYLAQVRLALLPDPAFDAFNRAVGEGEKLDFAWLADAVSAPPMMAERKLVEWHLGNFDGMREGDLAKFAAFCEEAKTYPESVAVFSVDADCLDVGTLPKRPSKLYTTLAKSAAVVCFEKSNDAALVQWLNRHFLRDGVAVEPGVAPAMLARCGHSMDALSGEVVKLVCYAKSRALPTLTPADVEAVCAATNESDAFGLTNAILDGDADAAYACLRDMRLRKVEPTVALASIARTYGDLVNVAVLAEEGLSQADVAARMKMHEYKAGLYVRCAKKRSLARLEEALALCRAADAASKSGGGPGGYLALEFLIARTLA